MEEKAVKNGKVVTVTPFQRSVYDTISKIPKGKVSTYGGLAKALGTCPRAVGGALRRNPYAPVVPCHRIVSGDLTIGGFSGSKGDCENTRRKRAMLEAEGVVFNGDKAKSTPIGHPGMQVAGGTYIHEWPTRTFKGVDETVVKLKVSNPSTCRIRKKRKKIEVH